MNNIHDFALEIEYNAKLKEYRDWEVKIQKEYEHLSTEKTNQLIAEGYRLTIECDNLLQQLRAKGLVSHTQVVLGFDIEPQQMAIAS